MNIGALWVTLGVDTSGLQAGILGMQAFQTAAQARMAGVAASSVVATTALAGMGNIVQSTSSRFGNAAVGPMQSYVNMSKKATDYIPFHTYEREVRKSLVNVSAELERLSNQYQRFGSAASRYLTLPIALLGGVSVDAASDLEFVSQKIIALANISEEQMSAWQSSIMSLSNQTTVSAEKVAETLYYVASAGIRAKEAMEIADISAKASVSGMGEVTDVARMLTYAINAYGKENLTAAQAADALTVAIREGTAEAGSLVAVIGDVIPVAAEMDVPFDEIVGSLAAMTRTGFNAHKAATALRQIMVSLLNPTSEAKNAMKLWSKQLNDSTISADGFRQIIKEKGLIDALVKVDELTKTFGESASGIVFGNVRALTGHLSLVGKNLEENLEILRKTKEETGAFEKVWERMAKTSKVQLAEVKNALNQAFIGMGQAILPTLLPILDDVIEMIKDLTNWFKELSSSSKEFMVILGLTLVAVGPLAMAVAGLIKIYAGLRVAIIATSEVMLASYTAMMANPYAATAFAIAGLIVALSNLYNSYNKISAAQQLVNKVSLEGRKSVISQTIEIDRLKSILTSELTTRNMKVEAINKLNSISPEYLNNITLENIKTQETNLTIEKYISLLERKAQKEAALEALTKLKQRELELRMDPSTAKDPNASWLDYIVHVEHSKEVLSMFAQQELESLAKQEKALNSYTEKLEYMDSLASPRNLKANEFRIIVQGIGDAFTWMQKNWSGGSDADWDKATKGLTKSWREATLEVLLYKDAVKDMYNMSIPAAQTPGMLPSQIIEQLRQEKEKRLEAEEKKRQSDYAAFSLDDKLKYWMDLMKVASEAELGYLSSQYAALDRIKTKQQELIDLAIVRANFKLESQDYKTDTLSKTNSNPEATSLKVQMQLDTKMLKLYTDWMNALAATGKLTGKEMEMLQDKILQLNVAMTGNKYAQELSNIKASAYLLGGGLSVVEAQISATNKAIKEEIDLYVEAFNLAKLTGDQAVMKELEKSIGLKKSTIATLELEKANRKLQNSLSFINITQDLLGNTYDATSEKLQAYYRQLDFLIDAQIEAKQAGRDFTEILKQIQVVSQNIKTGELTASYEKLTYALMDADNKALLYGNTYDKIGPKINAYTDRLNTLMIANEEVGIGVDEFVKNLEEMDRILSQVRILELDRITKQYTDTLKENNLEKAVQGKYFNEEAANIQAQIQYWRRVAVTVDRTSQKYEDIIKIIRALGKELRSVEEITWENFSAGVQEVFSLLVSALDVADSAKNAISGIAKGLSQLASGNPIAGAFTLISTAISYTINKAKEFDEKLIEQAESLSKLVQIQLNYNSALNEQIRTQAGSTFFLKDYAKEAENASTAFKNSFDSFEKTVKEYKKVSQTWIDLTPNNKFDNYPGATWVQGIKITTGLSLVEVLKDIELGEQSILDLYPELTSGQYGFNAALAETLLSSDQLSATGRDWLVQMIGYTKDLETNQKAINSSMEGLVGSLGDSILASIKEAWENGTDSFLAFKSAVSLGLQEIVEQMTFNAVFADSFTKLQKGITDAVLGKADVSDPFKEFLDGAPALLEVFEKFMTTWKELAIAKGFDFTDIGGTVSAEKLFDVASIAETIFAGISDGFKLAANTLGDFSAGFGDLLRQTLMKSISSALQIKLTNGFIAQYEKFITAESEGGKALTVGEIALLQKSYGEAVQVGLTSINDLNKILATAGIQAETSNQMTKAVQGMTVEQAGLIAGQFTAMRYELKDITYNLAQMAATNVESNKILLDKFTGMQFDNKENANILTKISSATSDTNTVLYNALGHLKEIAENTKSTADSLKEVKEEIVETNRILSML